MADLLSSKAMNSSSETTAGSRGHNALQRRAQQLKRWKEWADSDASSAAKTRTPTRVQFSAATLFLSAVAQNDVSECERLLSRVSVNVTSGDGLTALHQMAIDDNSEMVNWLLIKGADVNARDNEGWTPLHASSSCGHAEVVRLLVAHPDIDVFALTSDGELARDVADGETCLQEIERTMRRSADVPNDDSDDAFSDDWLQRIRGSELRAIEADVDQFLRRFPVPTAAQIDVWLEETRDVNSNASILHVCAAKGYIDVLERVLTVVLNAESTALLDSLLDSDGFTCLHSAAFWQQTRAVEVLLRFGANFELKTRDLREIADLCHDNPAVLELVSETRRQRQEDIKASKASETQRKLNAKRQRETRRPTQGVSREDVEAALKHNATVVNADSAPVVLMSESDPSSPPPPPVPASSPPDALLSGIVPHARRRAKRRSTGIEDNCDATEAPSFGNDCVDSRNTPSSTPQTTRSRSSSRSSIQTTPDDTETTDGKRSIEKDDNKDYKTLYKELLKENEFLLKKIKDWETNRKTDKELAEKRQLLRRIAELEEEIKTKEELLRENVRLKDENAALIRVISKLSK
ncbi:protein phosphatase 1 regulatory subunit 12C-like [Oppia nitens]|uniref:protein phosphatase 1 regulatory subunit 12C-like n=1 Tax=Oppia nitens TaxID=1686743 RepID=UPI0023DA9332|nr:protein phosphatase 1 regulatory subunit 12C-like [Oppia nitens]